MSTSPLRTRPLTRRLLLAVGGLTVVLVLGIAYPADVAVTAWFNAAHHGMIAAVTDGIYAALEPVNAVVLTVVVALVLAARQRDLLAGLRFGAAVALTWLPVMAFKIAFHHARPAVSALPYPSAIQAQDWSFPSGHTAFVTSLVVVGLLVARARRARRAMLIVAPLAIASIACVVLVNGLHFPVDVLASMVWALTVAPLMVRVTGDAVAAWEGRRALHPTDRAASLQGGAQSIADSANRFDEVGAGLTA